jgi:hypothetical protein
MLTAPYKERERDGREMPVQWQESGAGGQEIIDSTVGLLRVMQQRDGPGQRS